MRAFILRAALSAVLVPAGAAAQSMLTESQALARLSPDSPRVRAIRAPIDVARADVLAAARWPNPRVTYDREAVAGVTENITMVSQGLPITGRRRFDISAASALVDATTNRADDQTRRARADLRLVFADLRAAQIRERELVRAGDRLRDLAAILGKRESAGDAAGFDRLRAEREVLDIEADQAVAIAERTRAQAALAGFFADPADPSGIVVDESESPTPMLPPLDTLVERAETVRGELLALRQEIEAARFSLRAAERRRVPEPEVVAGTKSSTAAGGDIGSVVTIHASLPLFDRSRPERALAVAREAQARARAEAFRLVLRSQIAALRAMVIQRREVADRYRATAVNSADQIERIAQVSYDAGERGILELLDAHRTVSSARLRQTALDASVRQAEIELEFVSGWEMP